MENVFLFLLFQQQNCWMFFCFSNKTVECSFVSATKLLNVLLFQQQNCLNVLFVSAIKLFECFVCFINETVWIFFCFSKAFSMFLCFSNKLFKCSFCFSNKDLKCLFVSATKLFVFPLFYLQESCQTCILLFQQQAF